MHRSNRSFGGWTSLATAQLLTRFHCDLPGSLGELDLGQPSFLWVGEISDMLGSSRELVDLVVIEDCGLDFEGLVLVLFVAVEQDVVHPETPGVEVVIVPAIDEL